MLGLRFITEGLAQICGEGEASPAPTEQELSTVSIPHSILFCWFELLFRRRETRLDRLQSIVHFLYQVLEVVESLCYCGLIVSCCG